MKIFIVSALPDKPLFFYPRAGNISRECLSAQGFDQDLAMAFISSTASRFDVGRTRSYFTPHVSRADRGFAVARTPSSVRVSPCMAEGRPARNTVADTPRKVFLDRLKPLGKVRLVARNEAAIMESIATFDGLFFATIRSGEYANIIDLSVNLDMHLLLEGVAGAKFETGVSRSASKAPTYIVRILGKDSGTVLSVFMQWDKDPSDIEPERIEAWKQLRADYVPGEGETFFFEN